MKFFLMLILVLPLTAMWSSEKPWPQGRQITREVILAIPRPWSYLPGDKYLKTVPGPGQIGIPENIRKELIEKGGAWCE